MNTSEKFLIKFGNFLLGLIIGTLLLSGINYFKIGNIEKEIKFLQVEISKTNN